MNKLDELINQLETKIPLFDKFNQKVSQVNVAWHLEHSLLTLNKITDIIFQSNPKEYKWKFNFLRIVIFTMKKIPRGRAKSPEVVRPKGDITKEGLLKHLSSTKVNIKKLENLPKNKYFNHPFFGNIKLGQTIAFLEIHTKHHLEIIEDIVNK
jgi:hypothetical protein